MLYLTKKNIENNVIIKPLIVHSQERPQMTTIFNEMIRNNVFLDEITSNLGFIIRNDLSFQFDSVFTILSFLKNNNK